MNSALTALRKNQTVFLRLAEMRSVSDTAIVLGVTPGAISQSLKKLEISLGLVLFDRQCRPLKLTREGAELRKILLSTESQLSNALLELQQKSRTNPTVGIGLVESFMESVGDVLAKELFSLSYRVRLTSGTPVALEQQLIDGLIDVAYTWEVPVDKVNFSSRVFLQQPFVLVLPRVFANQMNLFAWRDDIWKILYESNLPLIEAPRIADSVSEPTVDFLKTTGFNYPSNFEIEDNSNQVMLVSQNVGWALLQPLCLLDSRLPLNRLVLIEVPRHCFQIYKIIRSNEENPIPAMVDRIVSPLIEQQLENGLKLLKQY
jgi:DNA-binding transcriptional LysR family regulator